MILGSEPAAAWRRLAGEPQLKTSPTGFFFFFFPPFFLAAFFFVAFFFFAI